MQEIGVQRPSLVVAIVIAEALPAELRRLPVELGHQKSCFLAARQCLVNLMVRNIPHAEHERA